MADQASVADTIAERFVADCRRDIAAAWIQIDAANDILRRTRWLLARWDAQRRVGDAGDIRTGARSRRSAPAGGMFVFIEAESRGGRRRTARGRPSRAKNMVISAPPARRTRPRSASG